MAKKINQEQKCCVLIFYISYMLILLSSEAVTKVEEFGEKAKDLTVIECPDKLANNLPVATSNK